MHTPLLAYHDPQFIDSDDGRPIRIVSEYLAPLRTFRDAGVCATVVFFGSARVRSGATTTRRPSSHALSPSGVSGNALGV